ncbi:hypothetical protein HDV06_001805 [Boothiomyces sp. JEL0866]|nr:hypothetical protein HDV06_001805 [Boothiomyces sp. JEL0866]
MKRTQSTQDTRNTRSKPNIYEEHLHLSFPAYFLLWLEKYGIENEKYNVVDQIVVHELRLPLNGSRNVEGQGKIRRFVWIEQKNKKSSILTFGAIFNEFEPEKTSYVDFLEGSTYGTSMVKPILRAYAEFISLITKDWILHIWADAPGPGETYLFRNAPQLQEKTGKNSKRNQELREKYSAFLKQSGFSGDKYEYKFDLPPLPQFGKKNEEKTINQFNELQKNISEELRKLNEMFVNTHCVQLNSSTELLQTYMPRSFKRSRSKNESSIDNEYFCKDNLLDFPNKISEIDNECFCKDLTLDFSDEPSAVKSSKELIKKLRDYGKTAGIYFSYNIRRLREKPQFKEYVENALHKEKFKNTE